jgi:D-alanyl-D-alanine carboxypeptidase
MTDRRALRRALAKVDQWLAYRQPRSGVPGIAVAASLDGRVVLDRAYGVADVVTGETLTPDHRFRVASHSKTFTATAVLQLAEAGRLRLDDAAADHLPWLRSHTDERLGRVSLRQLLAHGAGVIRDGVDADYWQLCRPFPDADTFSAEILASRLVLEPEEALKYSNYGYTLLGLVIEAVSGRSYGEVVRDGILRPLRLAATGPEWDPGLPGPWVSGHGRAAPGGTRRVLPPVDTRAMAPATGFYATASDLCRYFGAHFVGSGRLLSDTSKREMQRTHWHVHLPGPGAHPHVDYGLGMAIEHVGHRRTIGHSGGFPGQITRTVADPADGLVVSVLTNAIDGPASEAAAGILQTIDRIAGAPPTSPRLARLEGRYVNLWSAIEVVAAGERLLVGDPDRWAPLAEPDELEPVGTGVGEFRVVEAASFGSLGEPARFVLDAGRPTSVRVGGTTYWAEDRWARTERSLLGPPD